MSYKFILPVGLAFIAGLIAFSLLFPANRSHAEVLTLSGDCNLSEQPVCEAGDSNVRKVSFSLSPRPVPLLKDVSVDATVRGITGIRTAQVNIEGINMYMGIQIIPLLVEPQITAEQESRLSGTLQLPVCTSRIMEWQATLTIQTADKTYQAAFPFTTTADL